MVALELSLPHRLDRLPHTAPEHFRLRFYAAVAEADAALHRLGGDIAGRFAFLAGYREELVRAAGRPDRFGAALAEWERRAPGALPLHALRHAAGLDDIALTLMFAAGLPEEDPGFGAVFEALQGVPGRHRPTAGLLCGWWRPAPERYAARVAVRRLCDLGLIEVIDPSAPHAERELVPAPLLWEALRGDAIERPAPWARHHRVESLPAPGDLVVPAALERALAAAPRLLSSGAAGALVVRGPAASGRRTLAGAVARALGRGVLEISGLQVPGDHRWRAVGPLATALGAVPLLALDPGPGETVALPQLEGLDGPLAVTLGAEGGVSGAAVEQAVVLRLGMPAARERLRHWSAGLGPGCEPLAATLADGHRLTGGTIRRTAALAHTEAALAGRARPAADDVRRAGRALCAQVLDSLAERVSVDGGGWAQLSVPRDVLRELRLLERRCRHRERLPVALDQTPGGPPTAGVLALFKGPSGTGKTLAARLLAAELGIDLYRLDLAGVVNKYLGETEKNLSRVLARAEELDVLLLLDEGDALLTRRTDVQTANDRYANLETNYLLQRLESYEGLLVVTTNAGDRIDRAFERRMDVVVEFRMPDPVERWSTWEHHLPSGHAVDDAMLQELASRCALSGGQIRNAVLHAALLALDAGGPVTRSHVLDAVRREYRKAGQACPLRGAPEVADA